MVRCKQIPKGAVNVEGVLSLSLASGVGWMGIELSHRFTKKENSFVQSLVVVGCCIVAALLTSSMVGRYYPLEVWNFIRIFGYETLLSLDLVALTLLAQEQFGMTKDMIKRAVLFSLAVRIVSIMLFGEFHHNIIVALFLIFCLVYGGKKLIWQEHDDCEPSPFVLRLNGILANVGIKIDARLLVYFLSLAVVSFDATPLVYANTDEALVGVWANVWASVMFVGLMDVIYEVKSRVPHLNKSLGYMLWTSATVMFCSSVIHWEIPYGQMLPSVPLFFVCGLAFYWKLRGRSTEMSFQRRLVGE